MRKRGSLHQKTFLVLLGMLSAGTGRAQNAACTSYRYDYKLAVGKIYGYLLRGDNWEPFSDTREHKEIFVSKSAFKRDSRLEIVPCLTPDKTLANGGDTVQLRRVFAPTYLQFAAFLLYRNQPTEIIISSPHRGNPTSFGVLSDIPLAPTYQKFLLSGACLFFDVRTATFAYIKGNSYFYWNFDKKDFEEAVGIIGYRNVNHVTTDW